MQEPWLLHNFGEDLYGEELRLAIVGYIRPEVIEGQSEFIAASTVPYLTCKPWL